MIHLDSLYLELCQEPTLIHQLLTSTKENWDDDNSEKNTKKDDDDDVKIGEIVIGSIDAGSSLAKAQEKSKIDDDDTDRTSEANDRPRKRVDEYSTRRILCFVNIYATSFLLASSLIHNYQTLLPYNDTGYAPNFLFFTLVLSTL